MPRFGPAGNPEAFYDDGYKASSQMPAWLAARNLGAYEYQCGRGVNIGEEQSRLIGEAAAANNIQMSIHAPYYINLASLETDKKVKTIGYILDSLKAAKNMGAVRVILHPGSAIQSPSREQSLLLACQLLRETICQADEQGLLRNCTLCPEVMGKINQLGDLSEIMTLCQLDDRLLPCVDFGHLNARTQGALRTEADYRRVCEVIKNDLGADRLRRMHIHFSRIEYSKGGEKKHHRLADTQYGPDFSPLAEVMADLNLDPVLICESDGTQAADAAEMQQIFQLACEHRKGSAQQ